MKTVPHHHQSLQKKSPLKRVWISQTGGKPQLISKGVRDMREQKDWEIYTHSHNNVMMGFFWDLTTKPSAELDLSITSTTIYLIRSTSKANIGLILYIMKTILPMTTILVYLLLSQDLRRYASIHSTCLVRFTPRP